MIRVAVTTDRFAEAAPAFRSAGLEPVSLPCIRVEPAPAGFLARVREAAAAADLLVISSARTLGVLWAEGGMPAVAVAAVGEKTAAAARARGAQVVVTGNGGLADLVVQASNLLGSASVVFPHAAGADPSALEALREHAPDLRTFEVYRTVPVAPGPEHVDAVAFASPSAVKGWLLSRSLDGLVVGVIGPTTRDAVSRHRPPDVVALRRSHHSLANALASYVGVAA